MSAAEMLAVAAPTLLLPIAYLVWWADRFRLAPLARFVAVFALAGATGLLLASHWPASVESGARVAGPAMPLSALAAGRLPVDAADAARLVAMLLAVLVFLLARGRVETPLDGAVYGLAAGVGVALPAGWLLIASSPAIDGGELAVTALTPVVVGVVTGMGVAWARLLLRWPRRIFAALAGAAAAVAVAVLARMAALAATGPWAALAVLVLALSGAVAAGLAVELAVARHELAEEASLGVVPEWVIEIVPRYWRRVRTAWWPRRDERRALVRLLVQLAFRKHQLRHLDGERATLYSLEVGRLRERARRLLDPARAPAAADEAVE